MAKYLMQAVSGGVGGDGAMKAWASATPDFAATGFPGPGTALYTAIRKVIRDDVLITAGDGTSAGDRVEWNGSIWVKRRGCITPDIDLTGAVAADAAIAAAVATRNGAWIEIPEGTTRITSPKTIGLHGVSIVGRTPYGCELVLDGAINQDWITFGAGTFGNRLENLHIRRASMSSAVPSGYAIKLDGCFGAHIENVWLEQVENGIRIKNSTDSKLDHVKMRNIFGSVGLLVNGTAVNGNQTLVDVLRCDNGYVGGYPSVATGVVDWSASAAVSLGDIVVVASVLCWQVTTAGTLAATNSTLTSLPSTDPTLARSTAVTNGTAQLKYIGRSDLDWIFWDSYGGDLEVRSSALLNGGRGIRVDDTQAAGTPNIGKFTDVAIDHPLLLGVWLRKGSDLTLTRVAAGSCLRGTGVSIDTTFGKDWRLRDCDVIGNAEHGIGIVNAGWGSVQNCTIGHNSQKTNDTYDGIVTGTVTRVKLDHNTSGDVRDIANQQRYGINVGGSSDYYSIIGNTCLDNVTGGVSHPAGTGAQVANNV